MLLGCTVLFCECASSLGLCGLSRSGSLGLLPDCEAPSWDCCEVEAVHVVKAVNREVPMEKRKFTNYNTEMSNM